jgi:lipopolysaccharide transport system ATP-binding protein
MEAIRVDKLSKLFYLGSTRHDSLRDTLMDFFRRDAAKAERELWALKDVEFTVNQGETLGIVGKNGAGKSTLLKILSRITKPTSGTVTIHGRIGSLLEVGTGFHNELTGRENIFLSGAVLGMSRVEIARKFDEIVAFSEIEKFLDTPVKHYSTGMYMRLAFAVAAHLEPEVLIVDEVLAVGDAAFQRKCLNKMKDVSQTGRTVLFVSHDMSAITRICGRAIALRNGRMVLEGPAPEVVRDYLNSDVGISAEHDFTKDHVETGSEVAVLRRIRVVDSEGRTSGSHDIRRKIGLEATFEVRESGQILSPTFSVTSANRSTVFTVIDLDPEWRHRPREKGVYVSTVWIPENFMAEGTFFANFSLNTYLPSMRNHFAANETVNFDVIDSVEGDTARGDYAGRMEGAIRPILGWTTVFDPNR